MKHNAGSKGIQKLKKNKVDGKDGVTLAFGNRGSDGVSIRNGFLG